MTLAHFSSVGPTADGRIKPELIAPGLISTRNCHNLTRIFNRTLIAPGAIHVDTYPYPHLSLVSTRTSLL